MTEKLQIVPIDFDEAKAFVEQHHRHHPPPQGHKFSIAAAADGVVVGVCMVGRPVARGNQNGWTLEVTRLCTTGHRNACSLLYAAAWRAAKSMGYQRLITYILSSESGSSVRGAGWQLVGETKGGSWDCESRPRVDKHPTQKKLLFQAP